MAEGNDGNFYGVSPYYGTGYTGNDGAIYQVTPSGALTILHTFSGGDGATPFGGLVLGSDGNLYGTTKSGGPTQAYGTVFSITTGGTLATLYNFTGPDGHRPAYGLTDGHDGNFYGTTTAGGASDDGARFAVTPLGALTVLHEFTGAADNDGAAPSGASLLGSDGDLYGTTSGGGQKQFGEIFRATRSGVINALYSFGIINTVSNNPAITGSVIQGSDGNFYVTNAADDPEDFSSIYRLRRVAA